MHDGRGEKYIKNADLRQKTLSLNIVTALKIGQHCHTFKPRLHIFTTN